MKKHFLSLIILFSSFTNISFCDTESQEWMIQELSQVKKNMEFKYAPKQWKSDHLGWDLNQEFDKASADIRNMEITKCSDYQKIYKQFISSTNDYHVNALFYTRAMSLFPIQLKRVDNKFYVSSDSFDLQLGFEDFLLLDFERFDEWCSLAENAFNNQSVHYEAGDEVLAVNGIPTAALVEKIIDEDLGGDRSPTGYALATSMIFARYGKYGHETPENNFTIKILHQNADNPVTYELPWIHLPEELLDDTLQSKAMSKYDIKSLKDVKKYTRKDYSVTLAKDLLNTGINKTKKKQSSPLFNTDEDEGDNEPWYTKGFLPPLGNIIWEVQEDSEIYAYIYKDNKGRNIGYIYLPTFTIDGDVLDDLEEVITKFEHSTDALVFDITNNPGGYLDCMNEVLSMLTNQPLNNIKEQEKIIQKDVYNALFFIEFIKLLYADEDGTIDEEAQEFIDYFSMIVDTYRSGKKMTDPSYLFGQKLIKPGSVAHYSKPILVLINELDFSCADLFPALLQDNGRATLFGKKTAGAGGYVEFYEVDSSFGVAGYTLTGSIGYRLDEVTPLENLGVSPDVPYEITKRDITHNYVDYVRAVNWEVKKLLK